jgi:hypothetical protein
MTRLPPVAPAQHRRTIAACRNAARADVTAITEITIEHGYDRGHEPRPQSPTTDWHGGASGAATQHTMGACVMAILRSMSRRAFLPLIAGAALSPVVLVPQSARAQGVNWQIYRPEGLGFEAEMPGEPKIKVEKGERDDILIRSVDAVVDVDQISFSANFQEYRRPITVQKEADAQRQFTVRALEGRVARETAFTMNGFEAREMAIESDGLNGILRFVMVNNRRIMLSVMGEQSIHSDATARRFLDSLKLLP